MTFTNGISRNGNTNPGAPANATLFIDPSTGSTLGSSTANGVEVFSSGASATLTNGIAPIWIITDSGGGATTNPYNFVTYSSSNGYTAATASLLPTTMPVASNTSWRSHRAKRSPARKPLR